MAMVQPDPEDLTARARIRDAALRYFGEHGFERATIRGIAEAAGVSSGLVRHHFGSKQALRDACDEYLSRTLRRLSERVQADTTLTDLDYLADLRVSLARYQQYLARALSEGGARPLFDEMVRLSEERLAEADGASPEPPDVSARARATIGTAMALGVAVLHQHVSRSLGVDMYSPEGEQLLYRSLIYIYSHPVMGPEDAAAARAGLDRLREQRSRMDKGR